MLQSKFKVYNQFSPYRVNIELEDNTKRQL